MHVVEVTKDGVAVGTVRFRGITSAPDKSTERRFKCTPKDCIPRSVVRGIANGLSSGSSSGNEDVYAWRA